ncbi:MAG TPA: Glu/Leu/Phe/Val dehydrogenase dimerization domain-containing protein [Actinomycetota bacterium]
MDVFESLTGEYEQIVFGHDPETGLRTIIAVHSTALGPALGGTRFYPFPSEGAALRDVLRLAKGMAYKNAAAGLDLGGGKAVIIGDARTDKTPDLLRAYGRVVNRLGGAYVTTADMGTNSADMVFIAETTPHVTGTPDASGDPSPNTAYGVWSGMRAVAERLWDEPSMKGRRVAVQGVGKVGGALARLLADEGAIVAVADIDAKAAGKLAAEIGADAIDAGVVLEAECDVLAPCAMGAIVNDATIPRFRCRAIAGAANNQLERPEHGEALRAAAILYAPDYVINAGGVISVASEIMGFDHEEARGRAAKIAATLHTVFDEAAASGVSPAQTADALAERRILAVKRTFDGPGGSQ